jgi:hypothetical protein
MGRSRSVTISPQKSQRQPESGPVFGHFADFCSVSAICRLSDAIFVRAMALVRGSSGGFCCASEVSRSFSSWRARAISSPALSLTVIVGLP